MRAKAEDGTHTLMKGDEGVKLCEVTSDLLLLDATWHAQKHVLDLAKVYTFYGCSSLAKLKQQFLVARNKELK